MKTFFAVFFGILAAAAVIAGIFALSSVRESSVRAQRVHDSLMPSELRSISVACETYKATYGYFPKELVDLDATRCAAFSGPHCAGLIDEMLASGRLFDYSFNYQVTRTSGAGRVLAYTVTVTRTPENRRDSKNYFVDQSGVIRVTSESRPATASDIPWIDQQGAQ
jgi:hypothetical protein